MLYYHTQQPDRDQAADDRHRHRPGEVGNDHYDERRQNLFDVAKRNEAITLRRHEDSLHDQRGKEADGNVLHPFVKPFWDLPG